MRLVDKINAHITKQGKLYTPGKTITAKVLASKAQTVFPYLQECDPKQTRGAVQFMRAYTQLNKVLRLRGLQLRASNYYEEFRVLSTEEVAAKVDHLHRRSAVIARAATTLAVGLAVHKNQWTPLTDTEKADLHKYLGKSPIHYNYSN